MELRHLRYAVTLAECGTFTRAAAQLRVSQPTLSVQIRALERAVGAQLFERLPSGVRVTPAGQAFLHHARTTLTAADDAVHAARAALPATAPIRVGCFRAPWNNWEVTDALRLDDPEHAVEAITIGTPAGLALLLDGELDVLVGQDFTSVPLALPERVQRREVAAEPVWLALGRRHHLARRSRLAITDLADETWLVLNSQPDLHRLTLAVCTNHGGFHPRQMPFRAGDELPPALVELKGITLCTPAIRRTGGITTRDIGLPEQRRIFVAQLRAGSHQHAAVRTGKVVAGLHAQHIAKNPACRSKLTTISQAASPRHR